MCASVVAASDGTQAEGATPRDAAIVADACIDAARRIMTELLALACEKYRRDAPDSRNRSTCLNGAFHPEVAMHQVTTKAAEVLSPNLSRHRRDRQHSHLGHEDSSLYLHAAR